MELKQIPCDQNQEASTQIFRTIDNQDDAYQGRRVRACFHGWEILSNHPDNILWSLWNPLTSNLIRLPPLTTNKKEKNSYDCCLSSPPDEPCSVFLLLSYVVPTIVYCRLDRKRKGLKWIEMSYAKQLQSISGEDDCFLAFPTCCNGKVYAWTLGENCYRYVIQVDIVAKGEEEVVISLLPFVKGPDFSLHRSPSYTNSIGKYYPFLKGSCTGLFFISVSLKDETGGIGDVYLFKLDVTRMTWVEVVDFKDAMFYVHLASDYSACYYGSCSSEVGGYVHILSEQGKIISSFCAKDRTITISSIESQPSAWAMLEWRLESESKKEEEEDKDTQIVVRPVDGDTESESHLLNIPIDVLQMIMELCVGREYMRLRATCKHCCLAAPPIQWSSKATSRRLQAYSLVSPLLMVLDNYGGIITFIDPTHDDRYFVTLPQELKGGNYQIYCSRYGWLFMYEFQGPMVLFNPFTRNIRKLPAVPYLIFDSFCFSAPPTSPDCMVVGFKEFPTHYNIFFHLVSRDSTWRSLSLGFGDDDPYSYRFPIFKGRDVYALCNNKGADIIKFKDMIEDDDYSSEVFVEKAPPISGRKSPTMQYFLSKCDQHLLLVVVGEFGESVEVFEANESTDYEWEKINNLGKHVIFISDTSCICFEAKSPEVENNIYFPRLLGTKTVFYSMQTCRFHTFDDKQGFGVDLLTTKHHCNPHTWIEPSWS